MQSSFLQLVFGKRDSIAEYCPESDNLDSLPSLSSGILKRECAVRPFGKIDAATPEVAVASAILLADLMVASKARYRKVLPVPPGPSMKKETSKNSHILAVTDEDGYISLYNTRLKFASSSTCQENTEKSRVCQWVAHQNTIFDICWIKAGAGITEVHFLPFNPVDKRTAITYIDSNGNWHRASKGAPEQIIELCQVQTDIKRKAHDIIDKFADRGLRSLAVAQQTVPEKTKESAGGPWVFVGLLPLFDPPRHDSAETIRQALKLGVNVKMITGDQLAIAKETGRRLGMGTNMYPSSTLLGQTRNETTANLPVEELIEMADGFAGVFPEAEGVVIDAGGNPPRGGILIWTRA